MTTTTPTVEVVVPARDEAHVLGEHVRRLRRFLDDRFRFPAGVSIADSASRDATPAVAQALAAELPAVRVVHLDEPGRGRALRAAWHSSDADVVAYAAAVKSMSSSWHDFLFASLDPAGVMTVDKPPLSLWVQALSAPVFGFHPLALLVPQALMGVATTALVYDLVRRRFGRAPAFAAGLAFATTPMTVAVERHDTRTRCSSCFASAPPGASCADWRTAAGAGSSPRAPSSASASRRRWAPRCSSSRRSPRPACGSPRAGG